MSFLSRTLRAGGLVCALLPITLTSSFAAVDEQTLSSLMKKAEQEGEVRVIVMDQRSQTGSSHLPLRDRLARMEGRQSALSSALGIEVSDVNRLPLMPGVAVKASKGQLEQWAGLPAVGAIYEDELVEKREAPQAFGFIEKLRTILSDLRDIIRVRQGLPRNSIAVLDSGVDVSHPDLLRYVAAEACFSSGFNDGTRGFFSLCWGGKSADEGFAASAMCPSCSHGTHVAGIALQASRHKNRETGQLQVGADIVPVQVFSGYRDPSCGDRYCFVTAFTSDILRGMAWAWMNSEKYGIRTVNLSLGGGRFRGTCDRLSPYGYLASAMKRSGIAIVAASGNGGELSAISRPACASAIVAVGATDHYGHPANFSNVSQKLDFYAKGVKIRSTLPMGQYGEMSGTSMASPHVAGVYAAMFDRYRGISVDDVTNYLTRYTPIITDNRNGMGVPYVDAAAIFGYDRTSTRIASSSRSRNFRQNYSRAGAAGFAW